MSNEKTPTQGSTITKLEISNFKRIRAVTIEPSGEVVTLRGQNAQGKSSVLDAIAAVFGGGKALPEKSIRNGETEAHIIAETQDLVVERRWTANDKSYLEVKTKAGSKFPSPQKALDELVGALSFDPLAFMRAEPKKQEATLKKLLGLDFTALEAERKAAFDARTIANRDVDTLAARLGAMPAASVVVERVDPSALMAQLEDLQGQQAERETAARTLAHAKAKAVEAQAAEVAAKKTLDAAAKAHAAAQARVASAAEAVEIASDVAESAEDKSSVIAEVKAKLAGAEATNAKVRAAEERTKLAAAVKEAQGKVKALETRIDKVDREKREQLAAAKFPVEGLSLVDGGLTFNDAPLEQASSAQQLIVSVSMGLALNPKLRVMLIHDGSLLDSKSMAVVHDLAVKAGAQVWCEVVGDEGTGIVIEDGAVRA